MSRQAPKQEIDDAAYWLARLKQGGMRVPDEHALNIIHALRLNKYMQASPSPPQTAFMLGREREMLYAGEAGAGKTVSLALIALQYVDVPGHATLIIRRTIPDLRKPGNILPVLHQWLRGSDAVWNEENLTYTFPSGAVVVFTYMALDGDEEQFKSTSFQDILWEELTDFPQRPYRFMFRSLRKPEGMDVPLRVRAATNPGGKYHQWVKDWFLPPDAVRTDIEGSRSYLLCSRPDYKNGMWGRVYVHAVRHDNPGIDATYEDSLALMDEIDQARFARGDWDLPTENAMFDMSVAADPAFYVARPAQVIARYRYWDTAATEGGQGATTAGVLMSKVALTLYGYEYVVEDMVQGRWNPAQRNQVMRETAQADGMEVRQFVEQEPGGSGKEVGLIHIANLAPYLVELDKAATNKVLRAEGFAAQWNGRNVRLVRGMRGREPFLASLKSAPNGKPRDPWDGAAGCFNKLALRVAGSGPRLGPARPDRAAALPRYSVPDLSRYRR
jgi:phage terminase large subunit-like protein